MNIKPAASGRIFNRPAANRMPLLNAQKSAGENAGFRWKALRAVSALAHLALILYSGLGGRLKYEMYPVMEARNRQYLKIVIMIYPFCKVIKSNTEVP